METVIVYLKTALAKVVALVKAEPVLVGYALTALVTYGVLDLTDSEINTVTAIILALLGAGAATTTRAKVTPTNKKKKKGEHTVVQNFHFSQPPKDNKEGRGK